MATGVYERDIPIKQLQIMDKIFQTKSSSTKFLSALRKGTKLVQLDYHWQLEVRDNRGHIGVRDGTDQTEWEKQLRFPAKMRSMEMRESWKTSQKTDRTQQVAGPEKARQKSSAAIKLKKSLQHRCLSDAGPMIETPDPATADEFAGVFWWLFNPVSDYFTLPPEYRTPADCLFQGNLADFHETTLQAMMSSAFESKDEDDIVLDGWVGTLLKNRFNDWGAHDTAGLGDDNLRAYTFKGEDKKIIRCVDFLTIGEGTIRLHPTTSLLRDRTTGVKHADARRSGVFLDMNEWQYHFVEPFSHMDNTNEGGGPRGFWYEEGMIRPNTINGQLGVRCTG